jgi:hypothetical protein
MEEKGMGWRGEEQKGLEGMEGVRVGVRAGVRVGVRVGVVV